MSGTIRTCPVAAEQMSNGIVLAANELSNVSATFITGGNVPAIPSANDAFERLVGLVNRGGVAASRDGRKITDVTNNELVRSDRNMFMVEYK